MSDEVLIDTHVHFWDRSVAGLEWSWLKAGFSFRHWRAPAELDSSRYSVPEYREESAGCGVGAIVHGHSADPISDPTLETAWLMEVADAWGAPEAIVGKCTLASPDAAAVLRGHARYHRLRGVRDTTAMQRLDPDEIAVAMEVCAALGLSVEVRRDHRQFDVLHEVAARWPTVTISLSHACLPLDRTPQQFDEWATAMHGLAARANVVCKISALAGASDPDWTLDSIRPWILGCLEAFGADRCMFGSNWPVDRQFGTFAALLDAYREVAGELGAAERAALLHGTAERVYSMAPRT